MIPIITSAVGNKYVDCVKKFIEENPKQEIHLLTNIPEEFPTIHTYYYWKPIFNYFDNFIFGLSLVNKIQKNAFLWHSDQLEYFYHFKSDFNIDNNILQYRGGWEHGSSFNELYNHSDHTNKYWSFFKEYLKEKNELIFSSDIKVLWEAHLFLPNIDYKNTILDLHQLSKIFVNNSNKHNEKQIDKEGNGEGLAVGYSFWKNKIKNIDVMKYS